MKEIEPRLNIEDENTILNYKGCIEKEGYSFIVEWFNRNTVPDCYSNEQKLKLCHLLSIAAHEFRRETGKVPDDGARSCGLCLYHRKNLHTMDGCENCAIWGGGKICCREFTTRYKDNGLSLIIKLRKTFVEKYYEEAPKILKDYEYNDLSFYWQHKWFKQYEKETTMKTHNIEALLQPLKGDYWLFQVLWMNEKCRGLPALTTNNMWKIESYNYPHLDCGFKKIWLPGDHKTDDIQPDIKTKQGTTFAEIEKALREWSAWADKQIGEKEITVGTMVNVHDNSNSMMIMDGRVRQENEADGYLQNRNPHTILAINGSFPTETTCTKIPNNIMIRTSDGVIAFTHTRHVIPVRERVGEKVESDNPHIIKV